MRKKAPAALSHLDAGGAARMVDVSAKVVTTREAVARGRIRIAPEAMRALVGTPRVTLAPAPRALIAPVETAPWATA